MHNSATALHLLLGVAVSGINPLPTVGGHHASLNMMLPVGSPWKNSFVQLGYVGTLSRLAHPEYHDPTGSCCAGGPTLFQSLGLSEFLRFRRAGSSAVGADIVYSLGRLCSSAEKSDRADSSTSCSYGVGVNKSVSSSSQYLSRLVQQLTPLDDGEDSSSVKDLSPQVKQ